LTQVFFLTADFPSSHLFPDFLANLQYLIDIVVVSKKKSIFSHHKNFVARCDSERKETVVLSSGSSKCG